MLRPQDNERREAKRLDGFWDLVADPDGVGRRDGWWRGPLADPRQVPVPSAHFDVFVEDPVLKELVARGQEPPQRRAVEHRQRAHRPVHRPGRRQQEGVSPATVTRRRPPITCAVAGAATCDRLLDRSCRAPYDERAVQRDGATALTQHLHRQRTGFGGRQ